MTTNHTPSSYASQTFHKVAPYLYRTDAGAYYGRVKRNGKIHKQKLEADNLEMAKRKLKDFLGEVESKKDGLPDMPFGDFAKQWLESIKSHLKASTYRRRQVTP